jgi:ferredoxin, 2Fe-2S
MPNVIFVLRGGERREIAVAPGENLMLVARRSGLEVEGACDGAMACSTCHMIVEKAWYEKLPPASDDERDMLDLAPGLTRTSRLGCQITMTEALDGLTLKLPATTRNMQD